MASRTSRIARTRGRITVLGLITASVIVFTVTPPVFARTASVSMALPSPPLPTFTSAAAVDRFCRRGLAGVDVLVRQLEHRPVDGGWLRAFDNLNAFIEDQVGPVGLLSAVHPSKAVRDATQACEQRWQEFSSQLGQNEVLYRALQSAPTKDDIDRNFVRSQSEGFEDAGMSLPPAQRPRVKVLSDRIGEEGLIFDKHIRDAHVQVRFTEAELTGVPTTVWQKAPREADGRIVLGVDYPSYGPVLQFAEREAARERMWRAKQNEGGDANMALMAEISTQRRELAGLFGQTSFADYTLRRRMAKDLQHTQAFLDQVKATVAEREKSELGQLRSDKAAHLGQSVETVTLRRWDVQFYQEREKRERFHLDANAFRRYLPPEASLRFVMNLAERLMGVRWVSVKAPIWSPGVLTFVVQDIASGRSLGVLYVDLYPRDGKYNHAAVFPVRGSAAPTSTLPGRAATSALVVNFDRNGLSLDELETLLHEFGHAMHTLLSQTRYTAQAGTKVLQDFVEAPSQMLQDWVYDPKVMATFAQSCPRCEPIPSTLLAQARQAKDYGKGVQFARQHLYASFDLALHGPQARDPGELWAQMEGATPLGHVPDTRFVAGFSHIASNYAAGYYGYLWSLVLAMDMRTLFAQDKLSAAEGRRYRETVLSQGSQRPPEELLRNFLGRDPKPDAFFDDLRR